MMTKIKTILCILPLVLMCGVLCGKSVNPDKPNKPDKPEKLTVEVQKHIDVITEASKSNDWTTVRKEYDKIDWKVVQKPAKILKEISKELKKDKKAEELRKEIKTKYELTREPDDDDLSDNIEATAVPIVRFAVVKIPVMVIDQVEVAFVDFPMLYYLSLDYAISVIPSLQYEYTTVPSLQYAYTAIPGLQYAYTAIPGLQYAYTTVPSLQYAYTGIDMLGIHGTIVPIVYSGGITIDSVSVPNDVVKLMGSWKELWSLSPETAFDPTETITVPSMTHLVLKRKMLFEKIAKEGINESTREEWTAYCSDMMFFIKLAKELDGKGWTTSLVGTDKSNAVAWQAAMSSVSVRAVPKMSRGSTKHKLIGEVITPLDSIEEANQYRELTYFKSIGYDGVLLVWYGENPTKLVEIAKKLASDGWMVTAAYGAGWTSSYNDFYKLTEFASGVAKSCDGVVPLWRGVSPNHFTYKAKDKNVALEEASALARVVCGLFSSNNPAVKSYGVRIVTGAGESQEANFSNSYGIAVQNIGQGDTPPESVDVGLAGVEKKMVLVIGPNAYYKTTRLRKDITDGDARRICNFIEEKMLNKDIVLSTVTLAGDGHNDGLTKTRWADYGWEKK